MEWYGGQFDRYGVNNVHRPTPLNKFFVISMIKFITEIEVKFLKLLMNITETIFLRLAAVLVMQSRGHTLEFHGQLAVHLSNIPIYAICN